MEIVKTQKLLSSVLNANAQKIKVDSQLDSVWTPEGNAWFMAGYKDQMVSYCVGYKNPSETYTSHCVFAFSVR